MKDQGNNLSYMYQLWHAYELQYQFFHLNWHVSKANILFIKLKEKNTEKSCGGAIAMSCFAESTILTCIQLVNEALQPLIHNRAIFED